MRIIIGCALSMIFAANCVHAAAPVRDKPKAESRKPSRLSGLKLDAEQEVDGNVDYSKLVVKEIEKELKAKPSMAATGPSVFERPVSQEEQVRARAELERAKPKPRHGCSRSTFRRRSRQSRSPRSDLNRMKSGQDISG
jgi:hypothetical protein